MRKELEELGIDLSNMRGNNTTCPKCSADRKKSSQRCLSVNIDEGLYNCFHCHWSGKVFKANDKEETVIKVEPYKEPIRDFKLANGIATEYLKSRGISEEVIIRNKICETSKEVVFPYFENGKLVRDKKRRIDTKQFRQSPGCKPVLYKFDDLKGKKACIICEGELDALSWEEAGIMEAVSLEGGAAGYTDKNGVFHPSEPGGKFNGLIAALPILLNMDTVFIAMDNDPPGNWTAYKVAEKLGFDLCRKITYPGGCKDANNVLTKYGKERLNQCVTDSKPFQIKDAFGVDPIVKKLLDVEFDLSAPIEKEKTIIEVRSAGQRYEFGGYGQIGIFSGKEKSGKSFVVECLVASAIGGGISIANMSMNIGTKKILWFDTEQSRYFFQLNQKRLHDLAGVGKNKFYQAFHLRKFTSEERIEAIEKYIYMTQDIGCIVIDGIVDLMKDYNSLEESIEIVSKLMKWTDERNILLIGILHVNKGDGMLRGHLGSEIKNKCDFNINVSKEMNTYTVSNPTNRYRTFPEFTFDRGNDGKPIIEETIINEPPPF